MINKNKLSYQEMKILRYNKIKQGKTAKESYEEVAKTLKEVNKNKKLEKPKLDFKTEFTELRNKK